MQRGGLPPSLPRTPTPPRPAPRQSRAPGLCLGWLRSSSRLCPPPPALTAWPAPGPGSGLAALLGELWLRGPTSPAPLTEAALPQASTSPTPSLPQAWLAAPRVPLLPGLEDSPHLPAAPGERGISTQQQRQILAGTSQSDLTSALPVRSIKGEMARRKLDLSPFLKIVTMMASLRSSGISSSRQ